MESQEGDLGIRVLEHPLLAGPEGSFGVYLVVFSPYLHFWTEFGQGARID